MFLDGVYIGTVCGYSDEVFFLLLSSHELSGMSNLTKRRVVEQYQERALTKLLPMHRLDPT